MISWIQLVLQKHYKWLFSMLLGVIIISFIFTIGAPGISGYNKPPKRMVYNYDLSSKSDVEHLAQGYNLECSLRTGHTLSKEDPRFQEGFLMRAVLLGVANKYQIPNPTESELSTFIQGCPIFKTESGTFDAQSYQTFKDFIKNQSLNNESQIYTLIGETVRIQKVLELCSGPARTLPYEAYLHYKTLNTQLTLETLTCDYDAFRPESEPTSDMLQAYYQTHLNAYRAPECIHVEYLLFAPELMPSVKPTPDELKAYHDAHLNRYQTEETLIPFEKLAATVHSDYIKDHSLESANKAAGEFIYTLYERGVTKDSTFLAKAIKESGAKRIDIPPFSAENVPANTDIQVADLRDSLALNEQQYYQGPVMTEKGPAVILLTERLPSYQRTFESVESTVMSACVETLRQPAFYKAFEAFAHDLKSEIQDKTIATLDVPTRNNLKTKFRAYPKFALKAKPDTLTPRALDTVRYVPEGSIMHFHEANCDGVIMYVKERMTPDIDSSAPDVVEALTHLKLYDRTLALQTVLQALTEESIAPLLKASK